jgi:hypothetical protein
MYSPCLHSLEAEGNSLLGNYTGSQQGLAWTDMPLDIQLLIIEYLPLADLARMATMSNFMLAAYSERLQERQACIEASLAEDWPLEITQGLSAADMAVPKDLIVTPPVGSPKGGLMLSLQNTKSSLNCHCCFVTAERRNSPEH